jgi:hypothetical protein
MSLQPEYGTRLIRERIAEEPLPPYRFVKQGTTEVDLKVCTAGVSAEGVTLEPEEMTMPGEDGFPVKRVGFNTGEMPEVQRTGIAFIELGDTVVAGQKLASDSTGRGIPQVVGTTPLKADPVGNGEAVDGGDEGDFVRIDLDRRG